MLPVLVLAYCYIIPGKMSRYTRYSRIPILFLRSKTKKKTTLTFYFIGIRDLGLVDRDSVGFMVVIFTLAFSQTGLRVRF